MSIHRVFLFLLVAVALVTMAGIPTKSQFSSQNNEEGLEEGLVAGRNVNMVSGQVLPKGDPYLQRQNEPSIAVSTRNPHHMFAGANDYRTVDWPGGPNDTETGDAWLGVFKSYNGGQKWYSELLPGYPQEGPTSHPLSGFDAAADPTVRAGPNGLFFYSGIAFDRTDHGDSVVFVARYRDNNNVENIDPAQQDQDPFEYLDTTIIDTGTSGQFKDKPWIAVDKPRNETIDILGQTVNAGNVYIVYSIFLGEMKGSPHTKIMLSRSTDYGNNWSKPIKLSESQHINQGTTIAIDPNDGTIYVAWRRFTHIDDPHAIVFVKSTNFGKRFTKARVVKEIEYPFDQGTTSASFRTSAFPALAVDYDQNVYLAWSERNGGPSGYSRIMLTTSKNGGNTWSVRDPIEDLGFGHQIMPTLSFAAGKLLAAWYDLRESKRGSEYGFGPWIDDTYDPNVAGSEWRQTIDVRASRADPPTSERNPVFDLSIQVSRYLFGYNYDYDLVQLQYNPPNYPLFKQGTWPFIGDYIDITPAPMFIKDDSADGGWRFNYETTDPSDFHVTWTDNRDVSPPRDGIWTNYAPPDSFQNPDFISPNRVYCAPQQYNPGMRNQNIYTSRISEGFEVGSPGNFKPLNMRRAFVIFVKNKTGDLKNYILEIPLQEGIRAAFNEWWNPNDPSQDDITIIDPLPVQPYSIFPLSVFIESSIGPVASLEVKVTEIETGYTSSIVLNPDETNPENPVNPGNIENEELHDPTVNIANPSEANVNIANVNIANVNIANPDIIDVNIANVNIANVNIANVNIANVNIANVNIANVNIANTSIPAETNFNDYDTHDYKWHITNEGNTTSTFTFKMIAGEDLPEGLYSQLLIYRIHRTPATTKGAETGMDLCPLTDETHHELLVNIANPTIPNVNIANVNIANYEIINDAIMNAPFFLVPGEEAIVALRISEPKSGIGVTGSSMFLQQTYQDFEDTLGSAVVPHAANSDGTRYIPTTEFKIMTLSLPGGIEGIPYKRYTEEGVKDIFVRAFGGKEPYVWDLASDELPPDLTLNSNGLISGTPTTAETYSFTAKVTDANGETLTTGTLTIQIAEKLTITTLPPLEDMINGNSYRLALSASGGDPNTYAWKLADDSIGQLPPALGISSEGVIEGTTTTAGEFPFTIEVSDAGIPSQTATQAYTLRVVDPLIIGTTSLIDGIVTHDYSKNLEASGGIGTHTWSVDFSKLPPGLGFSDSGVISGTISNDTNITDYPHTYTFTVQVTDETWPVPQTATQGLNLLIVEPLEITSTLPLPDGQKESDYNTNLEAKGGLKPYIWILLSGSLPNGVNHNNGVISGKPTVAGTFNFTVQVSDSSTTNQQTIDPADFALFIKPLPLVIAPTSLPDGNLGSDYNLTLGVTNIEEPGPVTWILHSDPTKLKLPPGVLDGLSAGDVIVGGKITGTPRYDPNVTYPTDPPYSFTALVTDNFLYPDWQPWGGMNRIPVEHEFQITIQPKLAAWVTPSGGAEDDVPVAIAVDESSGNTYVTGYSGEGTGADFYTVKYDKDGNNQLLGEYVGPAGGEDKPSAIAVDPAGNVYVTGFSTGRTSGEDYHTAGYDKDGNFKWEARYDGPSNLGDFATAIAADSSGVYVTGYSYRGKQEKHADYYTVKYDSETGDVLWDVRYDGRRNGNDVATAIALDPTGVFVTGRSEDSQGKGEKHHDYLTIKYDLNTGRKIWEAGYDGSLEKADEALAIVVDSNDVYVTGRSIGANGTFDYCTVRYDSSNGNQIGDAARYDSGNADEATSIAVDSSGIYVTGKSSNGSNTDYLTLMYDRDLNSTSVIEARYNNDSTNGDDEATAIGVDSSGVYVTGFSNGENGADYFTIKYNRSGNIIWIARYNGSANSDDKATALMAIDSEGNVYVTGFSTRSETSSKDYTTIKY